MLNINDISETVFHLHKYVLTIEIDKDSMALTHHKGDIGGTIVSFDTYSKGLFILTFSCAGCKLVTYFTFSMSLPSLNSCNYVFPS